jgi:hypothetical protein
MDPPELHGPDEDALEGLAWFTIDNDETRADPTTSIGLARIETTERHDDVIVVDQRFVPDLEVLLEDRHTVILP